MWAKTETKADGGKHFLPGAAENTESVLDPCTGSGNHPWYKAKSWWHRFNTFLLCKQLSCFVLLTCLILWVAHSFQQFVALLPSEDSISCRPCTRNFFVLEHGYSWKYWRSTWTLATWKTDEYRRDEWQIHPELHYEVTLIYTCQLCRYIIERTWNRCNVIAGTCTTL